MRRTSEGILVTTSRGKVLLCFQRGQINASYKNGPLVNGTAKAFADSVISAALSCVSETPRPWHTDEKGMIRITDHEGYYTQTFERGNQALETLSRWIAAQ